MDPLLDLKLRPLWKRRVPLHPIVCDYDQKGSIGVIMSDGSSKASARTHSGLQRWTEDFVHAESHGHKKHASLDVRV